MPLEEMGASNHEQVSYFRDDDTGLKAIVAIHDTRLGPALGGARLLNYPTEEAALADVLALSRAMTYKAAAAGLYLGGGKAVVIGDPETHKTDELLEAYGRAVDAMSGRYITTEDVNTEVEDMDVVARTTEHVVGTSNGVGDPSPVTAHGIVAGMRACLEANYGVDTLSGRTVLVQGVGKVGAELAERLEDVGAMVKIAEPDRERRDRVVDELNRVEVVDHGPASVFTEPCDVFAPCAIGRLGLGERGDLEDVIPKLNCDVVAGSANNMLGTGEEARRYALALHERDILYAPDYVINAGGLIATYHEWVGNEKSAAFDDASAIRDRVASVVDRARTEGVSTLKAADRQVRERLDATGNA